jgi:RsbRD-like negative regulator of sigma factor
MSVGSRDPKKAEHKNQHSERVPDVIKANKKSLISEWLQRVKTNPELITVSLSDSERRDHVPNLLDMTIAHACGDPISEEERVKAAEHHGTLRYHQGYSVAMLILEAQLLQDVIAECIRDHVSALDLSHLIPDIAKISDTISAELRESSRSFMKHYEWDMSRLGRRTG